MGYKCKVSVALLTYNHEEYISQSIESALMQKCDFDYEIVIGEDCSTDRTREIVKRYKEKYPDKIKLVLHEKNVGSVENEYSVFSNCEGEYIAYLEGDDYWIDENKLQMEVDFLENNKDYSACYTDTQLFSDEERMYKTYKVHKEDICTFEEFYETTPLIPTGTFLFRRSSLGSNFRVYYDDAPKFISDKTIMCLNLKYGKIKYIDKKTSVYRCILNGKNSFCSHDEIYKFKDYIQSLRVQRKIVPKEKRHIVDDEIAFYQKTVVKYSFAGKEYSSGLKYILFNTSLGEKFRVITCRANRQVWPQ